MALAKKRRAKKSSASKTRGKEIFRKLILPHVNDWLSKTLSDNIIRFERAEGLLARLKGGWRTDYGRLCATKNKALFYGDVVVIYDADFKPNHYIAGYSPGIFYELEWFTANLNPSIKEVIIFKGTPNSQALIKELRKHGIKYKIVKPTEKEAYELAEARALGPFLRRLGTIYSTKTYITKNVELPEINFLVCNLINQVNGLPEVRPGSIVKGDPHPTHILDSLAENEANEAIKLFKHTYEFLTGKEPPPHLISKFKSKLRRIIKDFRRYYHISSRA